MRRRVTLILLLLLSGAIVNVAVAWGLCRTQRYNLMHEKISQDDGPRDWWFKNAPQHFPRDRDLEVMQWKRFANRHWNISPNFHHADRYESGWPLFAMERSHWRDNFTLTIEDRHELTLAPWLADRLDTPYLPLRPIWPGFAINTMFYAAILWVTFAVPGVLRRKRRLKLGLCPACAYPIGTSPICTECGAKLPFPLPHSDRSNTIQS